MNPDTNHHIVLASSNPGKIREIQVLLPDFEIIPQSEFVQTEAEETGLTLIAFARDGKHNVYANPARVVA